MGLGITNDYRSLQTKFLDLPEIQEIISNDNNNSKRDILNELIDKWSELSNNTDERNFISSQMKYAQDHYKDIFNKVINNEKLSDKLIKYILRFNGMDMVITAPQRDITLVQKLRWAYFFNDNIKKMSSYFSQSNDSGIIDDLITTIIAYCVDMTLREECNKSFNAALKTYVIENYSFGLALSNEIINKLNDIDRRDDMESAAYAAIMNVQKNVNNDIKNVLDEYGLNTKSCPSDIREVIQGIIDMHDMNVVFTHDLEEIENAIK